MITIITILGLLLLAFLVGELIVFLLTTCWWLGLIIAIFVIGGIIDWFVVKNGFKKLFKKRK